MKINGVEFEKKEIETLRETISDYMGVLCSWLEEEKESFGEDSEYFEILQKRYDKIYAVSAKFAKAINKK